MSIRRLNLGIVAAAAVMLMSGCIVAPPVVRTEVRYAPPPPVVAPPAAVVSVYEDPPLVQPAPIAVEFAPPPMLVQVPPPMPYAGAVWIGGYWGWQGRWVWCSGRWAPPPQPDYVWTNPYYENRDGAVVFVSGFWRAPTVQFVPPPLVRMSVEVTLAGVTGVRPIGPPGVFVPPPPGSRLGIVVPAPVGTAPAVVMSAPPVVNVGMRVQANTSIDSHDVTRISNTTVNNVTNVTNVTIVAPAGATASGRAFQGSAPAVAHLAAAQPASVHVPAPPATATLPAYTAGHAPATLPPPQPLRAVTAPAARPATTPATAAVPVREPATVAAGRASATAEPEKVTGTPGEASGERGRVEAMRATPAAVPPHSSPAAPARSDPASAGQLRPVPVHPEARPHHEQHDNDKHGEKPKPKRLEELREHGEPN